MVDSLKKPGFEELRPGIKIPAKETLLTPRFYTTDFDEMERMDISVNEDELRAILEEFRADYNRHHFVRDAEFEQSWDHIDGDTRRLFIEFLERSCSRVLRIFTVQRTRTALERQKPCFSRML